MHRLKDIKDYEGLYAITDDGQVWSYRSKKYLSPSKLNGYLHIVLYKNGQQRGCLIHRLVAEAFLPNPENLPEVNHRNENKSDNRVENLEWSTHLDNNRYGTRNERMVETRTKNGSRGAERKVIQYGKNMEVIKIYKSLSEAARETGNPKSNICFWAQTGKGWAYA